MTPKEKQLLLKDLCTRLPYGVICKTLKGDGHLCSIDQTVFGTEYGINIHPIKRDYFNDSEVEEQTIKPYLRPVSSMTEEEFNQINKLYKEAKERPYLPKNCDTIDYDYMGKIIDWLNENMFDYRGLIPMGLALEAKEGMYKIG